MEPEREREPRQEGTFFGKKGKARVERGGEVVE
jgi:hypothetical protein